MSTSIIERPNTYSAAGGVWRNPIIYKLSSDEDFLTFEIYKVGSTEDTKIGTLRKRVIEGVCSVDISSILRDSFETKRDYQRNSIQVDENGAFTYYIKYNGISDSIFPRMVSNAALETLDANYIEYVLGDEITGPGTGPGGGGEEVTVYSFNISTRFATENNTVCLSPQYATIYASVSTLSVGVTVFTENTLTSKLAAGVYRWFTSQSTSSRITIDGNGVITKVSSCNIIAVRLVTRNTYGYATDQCGSGVSGGEMWIEVYDKIYGTPVIATNLAVFVEVNGTYSGTPPNSDLGYGINQIDMVDVSEKLIYQGDFQDVQYDCSGGGELYNNNYTFLLQAGEGYVL